MEKAGVEVAVEIKVEVEVETGVEVEVGTGVEVAVEIGVEVEEEVGVDVEVETGVWERSTYSSPIFLTSNNPHPVPISDSCDRETEKIKLSTS